MTPTLSQSASDMRPLAAIIAHLQSESAPPDLESLPAPIARLLCDILTGALDPIMKAPPLPPPAIELRWAGKTIQCENASWVFDDGELQLHLHTPRLGERLFQGGFDRLKNLPAEVNLRDGTTLTARLAHLVARRNEVNVEQKTATTTYVIALDSWNWWPSTHDCFWVACLDDVRVEDGNLATERDHHYTAENLLLRGAYDLYLLGDRRAQKTRLVVGARGDKFDHDVFGTDFLAMEFSLGCPVRLSHLLAIDENQNVVGAAGLGFGVIGPGQANRRSPIATASDLYANYKEESFGHEDAWTSVLFSLLASRLREEGVDSTVLIGVSGYLESLAAGNIHARYLVAQVALEAICAEIVSPTKGVLVSSPEDWLAFVRDHEREIRAYASDEEAARQLVEKVKNAQQAPSSGRVASALEHFRLDVPGPVLKEVGRRNHSAHAYVMTKESKADVQVLADRLATIQTLLVAIIAKHVGFAGPIAGWEWVNGRNRVPDWWTWERNPIRKRYVARV